MASLNRATLIGNLTRDPEFKTTPSGKSVVSFAVATNSTWLDANRQKQEKAEFHNIVAWGKLAEICNQYLKKGKKVYIDGRLQTRDWQGQDGVKRYRTEIVADNMIMLDRGNPAEQSYGEQGISAPMMRQAMQGSQSYASEEIPTIQQEAPVQAGAEEEVPF
jgi:single-strand DNA-binding protein